MLRSVRILAPLLLVGALLVLLIWMLAFRIARTPPETIRLSDLRVETQIEWLDGADARYLAETSADDVRLRGLVDILGKPWPTLLLRQAAMGRLTEWYGETAEDFDVHIALLGIAEGAVAAAASLPPAERKWMERYADGVNAGLSTRRVRYTGGLVELAVEPTGWEVWHSIAIERLAAWLGAYREAGPPSALDARRRDLARFLGLEGLARSATWERGDTLSLRIVQGTSGIPYFTLIERPPGSSAVSLVGVPFWFAASSPGSSWAVLPTSAASISTAPLGKDAFVRVSKSDGGIQVVSRVVHEDTLLVDGEGMVWSGIRPISDVEAWFALERGETATFSLLDGARLTSTDGLARAAGPAPWIRQDSTTSLVAPRLHQQDLWDSLNRATSRSDFNSGALGRMNAFIEQADTTLLPAQFVAYALNWDGRFSRSSIGSTLYHTWWRARQQRDHAATASAVVRSLSQRLGSDMRTWRWESADSTLLQYPGSRLGGQPVGFSRRYAEVPFRRWGHPGARDWGTAPPVGTDPAPGAIELRIIGGKTLLIRRPSVDYEAFLGRSAGYFEDSFRVSDERTVMSTTSVHPL